MWKYYVNLFIYRCYFHEHFHYILFRQSNSQQIWHDSSLPMNTDCCAGKSLSKLLSQQSINKRNWRLWQSAVAACQTTSNSGYRDGHVASRTKDSFGILCLDTARSISDKPIAATVAVCGSLASRTVAASCKVPGRSRQTDAVVLSFVYCQYREKQTASCSDAVDLGVWPWNRKVINGFSYMTPCHDQPVAVAVLMER